jgi:hypothetical protein
MHDFASCGRRDYRECADCFRASHDKREEGKIAADQKHQHVFNVRDYYSRECVYCSGCEACACGPAARVEHAVGKTHTLERNRRRVRIISAALSSYASKVAAEAADCDN